MRFALGLLFIGSAFVLITFNAMTVVPSAEEERKWIEIVSLASMILSGGFWFKHHKKKIKEEGAEPAHSANRLKGGG
jgi:hypothetical protein